MDYRIIKSPSNGTLEILKSRIGTSSKIDLKTVDTVGLVQGKLIDMIYASDIAEKAFGVIVREVKGTCPQHMTLIAILGDTASVESALRDIKQKIDNK